MNIAAASAADLADVLAVERLAFGGEVEAGLVAELIADPTAQPQPFPATPRCCGRRASGRQARSR
ncbi:MAG: hypothetical protein RKK15_00810, partial [Defluviicoccus sp.]|nr:hypothetical protein [Defluviicoccus sp.]